MEAGGTVGWCSIGRGVVRRAGLTEGPDSGHGTVYGRLLARAFFHLGRDGAFRRLSTRAATADRIPAQHPRPGR